MRSIIGTKIQRLSAITAAAEKPRAFRRPGSRMRRRLTRRKTAQKSTAISSESTWQFASPKKPIISHFWLLRASPKNTSYTPSSTAGKNAIAISSPIAPRVNTQISL